MPNGVNGIKYLVSMMVPILSFVLNDSTNPYTKPFLIGFTVFQSLYCYSWDIIMDWGLFS